MQISHQMFKGDCIIKSLSEALMSKSIQIIFLANISLNIFVDENGNT